MKIANAILFRVILVFFQSDNGHAVKISEIADNDCTHNEEPVISSRNQHIPSDATEGAKIQLIDDPKLSKEKRRLISQVNYIAAFRNSKCGAPSWGGPHTQKYVCQSLGRNNACEPLKEEKVHVRLERTPPSPNLLRECHALRCKCPKGFLIVAHMAEDYYFKLPIIKEKTHNDLAEVDVLGPYHVQ